MCIELLQILPVIILNGFDCNRWNKLDMPEIFKDNLNNVLLSEFNTDTRDEIEEIEEKFSFIKTIDINDFI
jgi:hypothetical protein